MNKHQAAKRLFGGGNEYIFKPGDNMPTINSGPKPKFVRVTGNGELIVVRRPGDDVEVTLTVDAFDGVYIKKHVGTVDITPTWRAIMPVLIEAIANGTETGKKLAREELFRLADIADSINRDHND